MVEEGAGFGYVFRGKCGLGLLRGFWFRCGPRRGLALLFLLLQAVLFVKILDSFQGCQSVDLHGLFVPIFLAVVEAAWWAELLTSRLYGSVLDRASLGCHRVFVRGGLIGVQL